jgi:hypothetical protein
MATSISWPDALPLPVIQGYGIKPRPNVVRTELDDGPARQRLRSTSTTDEITVTFELTIFQLGLFESWFKNRALGGACWFNVTLLGGIGLSSCEARFKGGADLAYTPRSGERWSVTGTLEVRNRPMLSDSDLTLLLPEDPTVLLGGIDSVHSLTTAPPLWASGDDLYLDQVYGEDTAYLFDQVDAFHAAMAADQLWPD